MPQCSGLSYTENANPFRTQLTTLTLMDLRATSWQRRNGEDKKSKGREEVRELRGLTRAEGNLSQKGGLGRRLPQALLSCCVPGWVQRRNTALTSLYRCEHFYQRNIHTDGYTDTGLQIHRITERVSPHFDPFHPLIASCLLSPPLKCSFI